MGDVRAGASPGLPGSRDLSIAFVQGGLDVGQIITHRIKIDDFRDGFEAMRSGNSGKVVMDWG